MKGTTRAAEDRGERPVRSAAAVRTTAGGARLAVLAAIASFAWIAAASEPPENPPGMQSYEETIQTWRADRDLRLRSATGWLTIVGLEWLSPGPNAFGSGEANPVRLPGAHVPEWAGTLLMEPLGTGTRFAVVPSPDAEIMLDDVQLPPGVPTEIRSDRAGEASVLALGSLRFWIIERGGNAALRIRDPQSELLRGFRGVDCYRVDRAWRVEARFRPLAEPLTLIVPNILGHADTSACFGRIEFELDGETHTLLPMSDAPDDSALFVVFADATNGKETYGAGRFLATRLEKDGSVDLDFNKAYNPPCAFNPFTTCPLPPEGNTLPIAVTAGEKKYEATPAHESGSGAP
jgi:uncharacterized protein (DUF1684 family)